MSRFPIICLGLLSAVPAAANAECRPSFVNSSNAVTLTPSSDLDNQQIVERFRVQVRNAGDSDCLVRLAVSHDVGTSARAFPLYALTGPEGVIPVAAAGASSAGRHSAVVKVRAGGTVAVPYDLRLRLGWGLPAGDYAQRLTFTLLVDGSGAEGALQHTQLLLNIPSAARIRFAGPNGGDGPALLDIGLLSPDGPTVSPPFAIRVLSTAGYLMQLASQNAGALVRLGSTDRIPYRMSIGGRPLSLTGGGDTISAGRHTNASGTVHPVSIVVDPDPTRHAGSYSDRVTVTVTPL